MYKYNPNVNYQPNGRDWTGLSPYLHKQKNIRQRASIY